MPGRVEGSISKLVGFALDLKDDDDDDDNFWLLFFLSIISLFISVKQISGSSACTKRIVLKREVVLTILSKKSLVISTFPVRISFSVGFRS